HSTVRVGAVPGGGRATLQNPGCADRSQHRRLSAARLRLIHHLHPAATVGVTGPREDSAPFEAPSPAASDHGSGGVPSPHRPAATRARRPQFTPSLLPLRSDATWENAG